MKKVSRRVFLKISGASAAGALLSTACQPAQQPTPTAQPPEALEASATPIKPTRTPYPTNTPLITPTTRAYNPPDLIKIYPAVKSKVVRARDAAAWNGDKLAPEVVRQLVDRSITSLTGITSAKEAWQALFKPEEKIAIKVNAFRNSTIWTHVELVQAVTDSLLEAGIPGEQITIYDFYSDELTTAGFKVNKDGPGVRCYGTDDAYSLTWSVEQVPVKLSDILTQCDALINMPVLKSHMIAGLTFALKNHYGSISSPESLHGMGDYLAGLNALPPIKNTTRLVIGDALSACAKYSGGWPYWTPDTQGDSILMSHDPLAHDMVGLEMMKKIMEEKELSQASMLGQCERWIGSCAKAGLGAHQPENYELIEA